MPRRLGHLPSPAGAAPPRSASARRLALRGLAVAPAGLGPLAGGLLPRLRTLGRQRLTDGRAVRLGIPVGGSLSPGFAPRLDAPGRQRLEGGLPPSLGPLGRHALQGRRSSAFLPLCGSRPAGSLAPLPRRLVRVRYRRPLVQLP